VATNSRSWLSLPLSGRPQTRHTGIADDLLCAKNLHWIDLCRTPRRNCRSTWADEQENESLRPEALWTSRIPEPFDVEPFAVAQSPGKDYLRNLPQNSSG
jgi:hypothetical protein